ncbi:MAG TPA: SRPBCC family protein [Nannocystaceae bacterium]|nr:SRPBCC family protein [Nannocystaceae bacterium]
MGSWQSALGSLPSPKPRRVTPRLMSGLGWSSLGVGLALLGTSVAGALAFERRRRGIAPLFIGGLATGAVGVIAGTTLGIIGRRRTNAALKKETAAQIVTIARSPEDVYRYWRDFDNLPRFMKHVESVGVIGERRTHWTVRGPGGILLRWDAELVADRENEAIVWRSLPGADVDTSGSVQFVRAAGGRGTEVWLEMRYDAPGGKIGRAIAMLFGKDPSQLAYRTLRDLKQMLEVGEIVQSDASVHRGLHPARPSDPEVVIARKEVE